MNVRKAGPQDIENILSFCRELSTSFDESTLRTTFFEIIADAKSVILIAEVEKTAVGFIEVHLVKSLQSGSHAHIRSLFVTPECRRQGIAQALVSAGEGWAAVNAVDKVMVQSKIERDSAKQFYLTSGYSLSKVQNVFKKALRR